MYPQSLYAIWYLCKWIIFSCCYRIYAVLTKLINFASVSYAVQVWLLLVSVSFDLHKWPKILNICLFWSMSIISLRWILFVVIIWFSHLTRGLNMCARIFGRSSAQIVVDYSKCWFYSFTIVASKFSFPSYCLVFVLILCFIYEDQVYMHFS